MSGSEKVVLKGDGLHLVYGDGHDTALAWSDVYAVSFYKIDAITSLITYLTFDLEYGEFIETNDQIEGFEQMVMDLPKYLPIGFAGWQEAMAAARPEDAPVTIYERA